MSFREIPRQFSLTIARWLTTSTTRHSSPRITPPQGTPPISFDIHRGETFALLGPNGAGKSTTIEILEGYRERTSGEVRVLGTDPWRASLDWKARLGIVLQSSGESGNVTVAEQLLSLGGVAQTDLGRWGGGVAFGTVALLLAFLSAAVPLMLVTGRLRGVTAGAASAGERAPLAPKVAAPAAKRG